MENMRAIVSMDLVDTISPYYSDGIDDDCWDAILNLILQKMQWAYERGYMDHAYEDGDPFDMQD